MLNLNFQRGGWVVVVGEEVQTLNPSLGRVSLFSGTT